MLTPDPSSSFVSRLVLQGRSIDVTRAVNRDQATKLRDAGERTRERKDARNLYLMKEGGQYAICSMLMTSNADFLFAVIFPASPAAANLPTAELERRSQSYNARRTLLRSNPALYVSRTRLSVRQLPTFVTERVLKRLALHAARAFQDEVKSGKRQALSPDELESRENVEEGAKKRRPKLNVKQAKIVRQADRVEPLLGKGRSKGYGFIEMEEHADALRVLRWANNHPGASQLMWGWWKTELEDWLKRTEQEKEKTAEIQERLVRVRQKVKEMQGREAENDGQEEKGNGRTLLMEFSIENVSVVQRRRGKESDGASGVKKFTGKRKVSCATLTVYY